LTEKMVRGKEGTSRLSRGEPGNNGKDTHQTSQEIWIYNLCISSTPGSICTPTSIMSIQNPLISLITYAHLAISLPKHFKHPHCSPSSSLVSLLLVSSLAHSTISAPGPSLTAAATAKANVNENLTHNQGECLLNMGACSLDCLSLLAPCSVLSLCELFLFWTFRCVSKTQAEGEALRRD
jgi:hypothetical protein